MQAALECGAAMGYLGDATSIAESAVHCFDGPPYHSRYLLLSVCDAMDVQLLERGCLGLPQHQSVGRKNGNAASSEDDTRARTEVWTLDLSEKPGIGAREPMTACLTCSDLKKTLVSISPTLQTIILE
jgi:hypothetical protein